MKMLKVLGRDTNFLTQATLLFHINSNIFGPILIILMVEKGLKIDREEKIITIIIIQGRIFIKLKINISN